MKKTLVMLAGVALFIALFAMMFAPAAQTVSAQGPTATPVPPVAKLSVVGIPANAALTGAITATYTYITDTKVGQATGTTPLGTSGLSNVPINVPVTLRVDPACWLRSSHPLKSA